MKITALFLAHTLRRNLDGTLTVVKTDTLHLTRSVSRPLVFEPVTAVVQYLLDDNDCGARPAITAVITDSDGTILGTAMDKTGPPAARSGIVDAVLVFSVPFQRRGVYTLRVTLRNVADPDAGIWATQAMQFHVV